MSPEHLNRFGLILDFLSFFFVAPEFLGETRLANFLASVSGAVIALPLGVAAAVSTIAFLPRVFAATNLVAWFRDEDVVHVFYDATTRSSAFIVSDTAYVLFLVAVVAVITVGTVYLSYNFLAERVFARLIRDGLLRRRLFVLGAIMFIVGNMLQIVATF